MLDARLDSPLFDGPGHGDVERSDSSRGAWLAGWQQDDACPAEAIERALGEPPHSALPACAALTMQADQNGTQQGHYTQRQKRVVEPEDAACVNSHANIRSHERPF